MPIKKSVNEIRAKDFNGPERKARKPRAPMAPDQCEASLTKAIRALLKSQNIWHFKLHQGLGSTPGIPDIIGCWQGKLLAIEVKTRTGKVSPEQERKINEINRHGGLAFVARGIDDVISTLGIGDRFLFAKGRNLP